AVPLRHAAADAQGNNAVLRARQKKHGTLNCCLIDEVGAPEIELTQPRLKQDTSRLEHQGLENRGTILLRQTIKKEVVSLPRRKLKGLAPHTVAHHGPN